MRILNETIGGVPIGTLLIGYWPSCGFGADGRNAKRAKEQAKGLNTKLQCKNIQGFERE